MPLRPAGDRGPGDQRRHRAGGAADHDVLRRAPLQPERVDEDVAEEAGERERRRQRVDRERQQGEGRGAEQRAEGDRGGRRDAAAGHRAGRGAGHRAVDVAIDCVVDRAGATGREGAAEAGEEDEPERGVAGHVHRRDRREQQQRLHLRLGQREVVAQQPKAPPGAAGWQRSGRRSWPVRLPAATRGPAARSGRCGGRSPRGCRASAGRCARRAARRSCAAPAARARTTRASRRPRGRARPRAPPSRLRIALTSVSTMPMARTKAPIEAIRL